MNSKGWFAPYSTGIKTVHSISVPASPWIYSLRANTHKYFEVEHSKEDKGRGGKEMGLLLVPYDWPGHTPWNFNHLVASSLCSCYCLSKSTSS